MTQSSTEDMGDPLRREATPVSRVLLLAAACVALLGVAGSLGIALFYAPTDRFLLVLLRLLIGPAVLSVAVLVVGLVIRAREQRSRR